VSGTNIVDRLAHSGALGGATSPDALPIEAAIGVLLIGGLAVPGWRRQQLASTGQQAGGRPPRLFGRTRSGGAHFSRAV
jgi:hypothetical protein